MIFVYDVLGIDYFLLYIIVWSVLVLFLIYCDVVNFNYFYKKLKFKVVIKIYLYKIWCRVYCDWVEFYFGEVGIGNFLCVVMRVREFNIFSIYSKNLEYRTRFFGV